MKQQTPKLRDLLRTAPPRRAAPTSPPQLSPPESAHRPRPNRGTESGAPPAPRPRCPPRPREGSSRVAALPPPPPPDSLPAPHNPPPQPPSRLGASGRPAARRPRAPAATIVTRETAAGTERRRCGGGRGERGWVRGAELGARSGARYGRCPPPGPAPHGASRGRAAKLCSLRIGAERHRRAERSAARRGENGARSRAAPGPPPPAKLFPDTFPPTPPPPPAGAAPRCRHLPAEDTGLKANMRGGSREKGRKRLALPAPTRSCVRPNACGTALPWGGRGRGPEARGLPTGGWTEPAVWREPPGSSIRSAPLKPSAGTRPSPGLLRYGCCPALRAEGQCGQSSSGQRRFDRKIRERNDIPGKYQK
ncbi:proline-rich protein HaeIII subfamily 1-like [Gallus gallus]|uniref:proline-rich protein HaeIII subfamily 1-like n=1 Tax=Gallus gallus TaxID=9031 RepID=UPI001AEACFDC|nr:proline-rich protein HaeIII subfamily 1-like [Gallus gallus]